MNYILIFIFGLFFGSFLGVLADRIAKNKDFIKGRSKCDYCKKELSWIDLIPVISFLILGGRCRYCRKSIGIFYPSIEISTGILFLITFMFIYGLNFQFSIFNFQLSTFISLLYYLFIVSSLIVIFFTDLKNGIIPDKIVFPGILLASIYLVLNPGLIVFHLISAFISFLLFLIMFIFTKGKGMGFGDVKLVFFLGLFLGFPKIVFALYLAFLTGAFVSIILILWRRKKFFKDTIPFGPFLILGTFLSVFAENQLILLVKYIFHI